MIPRFRPNLNFSEFQKIFLPASKNSINKFEKGFSELVGQRYSNTFSYGRMALLAYLKAMNIENKEIICTSYTCLVMAHAIEKSGNRSVFIDINLHDLNMNFDLLKNSVTENTAAIIFTSLYGNPVNLVEVEFFKKNYPHIKIIQDCTHIIDGKWDGEAVAGSGDVAIFGLGLSKPITTVFGGILTTNDFEAHQKINLIKDKSFNNVDNMRSFKRRIYLFLAFFAFNHFLYKLTNFLERIGAIDYFVLLSDLDKITLPADSFENLSLFEAEIGLIQLSKYSIIKNHNRKISEVYQKEIYERQTCIKIINHPGAFVSHVNLLVEERDRLMTYLLKHNIQVGDMYNYSIPEISMYKNHFHYSSVNNSLSASRKILNLPLCVTKEEAENISRIINTFYI